jgi:hypothetical protein
MSENDDKDLEGQVLPKREVLTLINPTSGAIPGFGAYTGGDPTIGTPTPAGDATHLASHAADGQTAAAPSVSDQPQDLSSTSTHTESSQT